MPGKTLFILDVARTCYPPFLSSHDPFYWNKTVANEKKHAIREQPNKYGKQPNNYGKKTNKYGKQLKLTFNFGGNSA